MGDDDDGVLLLELADQVFDGHGGDWVQRGAGLVHQQHVGLHGDCPCDAQPLLLPPRQSAAGFIQSILDLVPQVCAAQRGFGRIVEHLAIAHTLQLQAGNHIVANRHGGEWIRPLKHHPDCPADTDRVDTGGVDILIIEQYGTLDSSSGDDLMHPVQGAQHRRLAAARGTDERRDAAGQNRQRHISDRMK